MEIAANNYSYDKNNIKYGSVEDIHVNDINGDDWSSMMIMKAALRSYGGRIATATATATFVFVGCATYQSNASFAIKNNPSIFYQELPFHLTMDFNPNTDTCFRNSANIYCWSRGSEYTGCKPMGDTWTETNGYTQAGEPYCGENGGNLCSVFSPDTLCAYKKLCLTCYPDKSDSLSLSNNLPGASKSASCQKGCNLAHTGQSSDDDCDLNCGAGWNYMEGVGKSMCNYDNHNGGVGVTIDDDVVGTNQLEDPANC